MRPGPAGIGSIDVAMAKHYGDSYNTTSLWNTQATIHLKVEGGIPPGQITLNVGSQFGRHKFAISFTHACPRLAPSLTRTYNFKFSHCSPKRCCPVLLPFGDHRRLLYSRHRHGVRTEQEFSSSVRPRHNLKISR